MAREVLDYGSNESFVVLSDLHSFRFPIEKIQNSYMKKYKKIYILGDITERGITNDGAGGVELLIEVMNMCKSNKYPADIVYIPGNHDQAVVAYLRYNLEFEPDFVDDLEKQKEVARKTLAYNKGSKTIEDLEKLYRYDKRLLAELYSWLTMLPLQRIHVYNNQKYALAHAFFDMKLYRENKNYNLQKYFLDYECGVNLDYCYARDILWYRPGETEYEINRVPSSDYICVVGHNSYDDIRTLKTIDLVNRDNKFTKVYCVDPGSSYLMKNMFLVYDGEGKPKFVDCTIDKKVMSGYRKVKKSALEVLKVNVKYKDIKDVIELLAAKLFRLNDYNLEITIEQIIEWLNKNDYDTIYNVIPKEDQNEVKKIIEKFKEKHPAYVLRIVDIINEYYNNSIDNQYKDRTINDDYLKKHIIEGFLKLESFDDIVIDIGIKRNDTLKNIFNTCLLDKQHVEIYVKRVLLEYVINCLFTKEELLGCGEFDELLEMVNFEKLVGVKYNLKNARIVLSLVEILESQLTEKEYERVIELVNNKRNTFSEYK